MQRLVDRMTIKVPEGALGGMRVERFEVGKYDLENMRQELRYGRGTPPGIYTKLMDGDELWMSDVRAEKEDHKLPVTVIELLKARRVLINGLGLGMVVQAALSFDHVEHIDVVERDERVIKLVGPTYEGPRVTIHHADAYDQMRKWTPGTRWDVGWSDIWPTIDSANLESMGRLNRSYGQRSQWHYCWGQKLSQRLR